MAIVVAVTIVQYVDFSLLISFAIKYISFYIWNDSFEKP